MNTHDKPVLKLFSGDLERDNFTKLATRMRGSSYRKCTFNPPNLSSFIDDYSILFC
jgi:hypothetical protein